MTPRIVSFTWQGRPPLLNAERSGHWRQHRELTKAIRLEAALCLARDGQEGQMGLVKVDIWQFLRDARLPDAGACIPAVKAIIDGAVDARLLPHDGPAVVKHLAFWHPRTDVSAGNMLLVTFEEITKESPWAK